MKREVTSRAPGFLAFAFIAAALSAGFLPVLWLGVGQGLSGFDPYLARVLRFTLVQAGLSTVISMVIGVPVARALARQRFRGRGHIVRLLSLPLALPAIVVIIGVIEVYGSKGWLGGAFEIGVLSNLRRFALAAGRRLP